MHFSDKVVWITGASSGIGLEVAKQLATQNAKLILTATNLVQLNEIAINLKNNNNKIYVLEANLLETSKIENLVVNAIAIFGKIDYIIQSAGVSQRSLVENTNESVYRTLMELNFFAPMLLTNAILPHFQKNGSGSMTVICSVAGLFGYPLRSAYAASKHAIKGYLETLQTEFYKTDINVSIVYSGRVNTNISRNALLGNGIRSGQNDENNVVGMDVVICARKIIKGIKNKNKQIVITKSEKLLLWIWWFWPNLFFRIANSKGVKT